MTTTARQTTRSASRSVLNLLWVLAASMLVPIAAFAQANACDQLKATLAARIEATGVRGYSLETVPASTAVPAGAKAIGNCEGGARKVLYRRWGGASGAVNAEAAAAPVAPPPGAVAPEPRPKPPPVARPNVPVAVASVVAPKPVPVPAPVLTVAPEPIKAPLARAAEVDLVPKPSPALAQETPTASAETRADKPPLSQRIFEFVSAQWRWLLVLLLAPLALLGWAWRAHHLAYDKNGLPRGPRL